MEQALVDHVGQGEWLDLAAEGEPVDEAAMRSWGDARICRASVIRDILRGRLVADPDPHGLQLRGARIAGRLDLENLATNVGLELSECFLEEGILARDARLFALDLNGCRLEHPAEPPLDAQRLTCGALGLAGARITGHGAGGAVQLSGAHIGSVYHPGDHTVPCTVTVRTWHHMIGASCQALRGSDHRRAPRNTLGPDTTAPRSARAAKLSIFMDKTLGQHDATVTELHPQGDE